MFPLPAKSLTATVSLEDVALIKAERI